MNNILKVLIIESYIHYKLFIRNKCKIYKNNLDYMDMSIVYSINIVKNYKNKSDIKDIVKIFKLAEENRMIEMQSLIDKIVNKRKIMYNKGYFVEECSQEYRIRSAVKGIMMSFLEFQSVLKDIDRLMIEF